jgi:alpha-galactosidase/6-phospho-beta-glucosidase family protein
VKEIEGWKTMRQEMVNNIVNSHILGLENMALIEAMETNVPFKFGGNVLNTGRIISNLPEKAELSIDDMISLCDDLFEAHGSWLPHFQKIIMWGGFQTSFSRRSLKTLPFDF